MQDFFRMDFLHSRLKDSMGVFGNVTDNLITLQSNALRLTPGSLVFLSDLNIQRANDDGVNVFYDFVLVDREDEKIYNFEYEDLGDTSNFLRVKSFSSLVFKASKYRDNGKLMFLSVANRERAQMLFEFFESTIQDLQLMRDDGDTSSIAFSDT